MLGITYPPAEEVFEQPLALLLCERDEHRCRRAVQDVATASHLGQQLRQSQPGHGPDPQAPRLHLRLEPRGGGHGKVRQEHAAGGVSQRLGEGHPGPPLGVRLGPLEFGGSSLPLQHPDQFVHSAGAVPKLYQSFVSGPPSACRPCRTRAQSDSK